MSKAKIYVVAPSASDPLSLPKRQVLVDACRRHTAIAVFPAYQPGVVGFDLVDEVRRIKEAAFAIVDVSFERPSCYFELGMIEALGCPVSVIALQGTVIHQTSHRASVELYESLAKFETLIDQAMHLRLNPEGSVIDTPAQ